ncbi:hypothetical protein [Pseudoroseicyclus aestuarii]|uniref:TspO/MBR related protein n=1 Tax=Pseudoroseicyclus aestuarii TaxID=1795041 RepID=A0A318SW24_9RHOB|nr:hypothetical protein [Pseudoroseicyclus aestuarii]PYE84047.1 hypothetical protein DFP88_103411 [Pseudoroseicyclus aestuarii]
MRRLLPYLTLLLTLTFAASAWVTPFPGFRNDALPIPQPDPLIQPADWAFAVWGVIFAWLIGSAVFGVIARRDDAAWDEARVPLCLSLLFGTPWLLLAKHSAVLATIDIVIMLVFALAAMLRAPRRDIWWLALPVGLYAGWLTAASFVALAITSAGFGLIFGSLGWAWAGLILALTVALLVLEARPWIVTYAVTVAWALIGILAKDAFAHPLYSAVALLGILALALVAFRGQSPRRA